MNLFVKVSCINDHTGPNVTKHVRMLLQTVSTHFFCSCFMIDARSDDS